MNSDEKLLNRIELLVVPTENDCYGQNFLLKEEIGTGNIRRIVLGSLMQIMISEYELKNDTVLSRPKDYVPEGENYVTFTFRNFRKSPAVIVSSIDMDLEIFTPANSFTSNLIITIHSSLLNDLLNIKDKGNPLNSIIIGDRPFVYEEIISSEIQSKAILLCDVRPLVELASFHYRVMAEELIFLFLALFLKRGNIPTYPINKTDVKTIYQIREKISADLKSSPSIHQLTKYFLISESKMQRLFKQVFGTTIHNYHQSLRIREAARLIRDEKMSISEVGYSLNYTNMSYFGRAFKKHVGLNPKKYSMKYK